MWAWKPSASVRRMAPSWTVPATVSTTTTSPCRSFMRDSGAAPSCANHRRCALFFAHQLQKQTCVGCSVRSRLSVCQAHIDALNARCTLRVASALRTRCIMTQARAAGRRSATCTWLEGSTADGVLAAPHAKRGQRSQLVRPCWHSTHLDGAHEVPEAAPQRPAVPPAAPRCVAAVRRQLPHARHDAVQTSSAADA